MRAVTLTHIRQIVHQLKQCQSPKDLYSLHAFMIKLNLTQDCFLMNQFITACSTLYQMNYSFQLFDEMQNPNVYVYNAIIRGFVHCKYPYEALTCYVSLLRAGVLPTSYTFSSLMKACGMVEGWRIGESVHGHVWRVGFDRHVFVQTSLIDFYSGFGRIVEARKMFDEMPDRDVFAWTTMVSAYVRVVDMRSARVVFDGMPERNTATWNTMIDGFSRIGDVESAELFFGAMPCRDIISWTSMIRCYSQSKRFREALVVFKEMTEIGVRPDEVTMSIVISACAHLGALDLGKEVHFYVMQNGFEMDVYIGSALIDMYSKCGNLDRSLLIFFKLQDKNLYCWNAIIEGLAVHGLAEEAIAMFRRMEKGRVEPNGVTFISVLSACTHGGLVEEGRRIFNTMTYKYSIIPEVAHYGCMVDLLGKAGLLDDALDLIRNMKIEPNSVIWGALLSGCKLHKNLETAELAVNKLMVLEPDNSGYYTLLTNMYADQNHWAEVAKIRATMKELGIEKNCPGSSWIELGKKVHHFTASDESHLDFNEISLLLVELDGQLKLAGHVPEVGFIL